MIYRDVDGTTIQENARTTDRDKARRLLAKRALVNLQARVRALREIVRETPEASAAGAGGSAAANPVRNNMTETPNTAGAIDLFARILRAVEEEERERNGVPGPNPEKTER